MISRPSLLFYLHGFNSSSLSHKASVMRTYCQQHRPHIKLVIPQLPNYPLQAAQFVRNIDEQHQQGYRIGLVGSSLGGYLATWLNHKYGYKTVLVNPAIKPFELLTDFLGEQINPYTQERYVLEEKHIQELRDLYIEPITQIKDFWLLQQIGDEVLDYHQAMEKYALSKQNIEAGGNHSFIGFDRYPSQIIDFLKL